MAEGYSGIPLPLDDKVWLAIQDFSDQCEQNWEDPEYGKAHVEVARTVASHVFGVAGKLAVEATTAGWEQLEELLKAVGVHDDVLDAIQVTLAEVYATDTRGMAERCLKLAQMAITARPRAQVGKFLARVSRCYVLGLDPECIILCRAVLETAVTEAFDRRDVPLPSNEKGKSEMATRLDAAVMFNWLTPVTKQDAMDVWFRGNQNIHRDPDAATDAAGTVEKTMRVLQALYRET